MSIDVVAKMNGDVYCAKSEEIYFFLSLEAPFFLAVPRNFLARFLRSLRNLRDAFSTLAANPLRTNRKRGSKFIDSRES